MTEPAESDFAFLMGEWQVRHERLRERLAGCTEWVVFDGRTSARPLLGGLGNIDENVLELPEGRYEAVTLRLYDPGTRNWSIWWIDARSARLEPPVHGRFENGIGEFMGDDAFGGRPIKVRFRWSGMTPQTARWEQAFSDDDGASWETNWRMAFTRLE